jgi:conjugative transfer signal peptidase TraF
MFGRKIATGCLGAVVVLAMAVPHAGIRWNHTPSMPVGVWLQRPSMGGGYTAGDIVEVCPALTAWERVYVVAGDCPNGREPMLKPIAAIPGDTVSIDSSGVVVNGKPIPDTAALMHDRQGRELHPFPAGQYAVAAGEVWLIVSRSDSLDSRYLGPVSIAAIRGLAVPVWVWK